MLIVLLRLPQILQPSSSSSSLDFPVGVRQPSLSLARQQVLMSELEKKNKKQNIFSNKTQPGRLPRLHVVGPYLDGEKTPLPTCSRTIHPLFPPTDRKWTAAWIRFSPTHRVLSEYLLVLHPFFGSFARQHDCTILFCDDSTVGGADQQQATGCP